MFLLYPIALGLVVGLAIGGRLSALESMQIRWAPLAIGALLVQVALFSPFVAERIGAAGPPIYVQSTAAVVAVALRNGGRIGLAIVALGGLLNLVAIIANGGFMPADPGALAALGRAIDTASYTNSSTGGSGVVLWPLTDVFAMPRGLPGANVFSVGDVLIAVGVFAWIVDAMRRPAAE